MKSPTSSLPRRLLSRSLAGALALVLSSPVAFAATSGTVTLGGTVVTTLEITAAATIDASTLVLTPGEKIVLVADLAMLTNNQTGLTLTVTSGNLTKAAGANIAFQVLTLVDAATTPLTGAFVVASGVSEVTTPTLDVTDGDAALDLYIKYTPAVVQDPGTYAGSIGVSVADNA